MQADEFAETPFDVGTESHTLEAKLAAYERRVLEDALRRHGGNRSAAGRELGVSPRMMNYRHNKLGIGSAPAV